MKETVKASAPGRLDVMGGIADYSGSLVLQKAVTRQTSVELKLRDDYKFSITSQLSNGEVLKARGDYRSYLKNGEVDYTFAQQAFKKNQSDSWIAYILGCALVLQKEKGIDFKGADINLKSDVPNGKGVASSASLEVATMKAIALSSNISFSGTEQAILAQRVENLIVGAPCGLMDQLASSFGNAGALLPIVCQPDILQQEIDIPSDISFIGIDSGIRHQVAGASYGDVRCAAFMGYSIITKSLGLNFSDLQQRKLSSLPFKGYLSNISIHEFEEQFQKLLPDRLSGKDFLENYGGTIDRITQIDPNKTYSIRNSASHPVYENHRIKLFMQHLIKLNTEQSLSRKEQAQQMGKLMQESHSSYTKCGLGTERTDEILSLALAKEGILGGRITGGGNGGTVCLLAFGEAGRNSAIELHNFLCELYKESLGLFL